MYLTIWFLLAFTTVGFIAIIGFLIKFNRRKRKISKYVKHLPSPKEYPVFGSALRFFGKSSEGELKSQKMKTKTKVQSNKSNMIEFNINRNYERGCGIYGSNENAVLCLVWWSFGDSH